MNSEFEAAVTAEIEFHRINEQILKAASELANEADRLYLLGAYHSAVSELDEIMVVMRAHNLIHPRVYFVQGFLNRALGNAGEAKRYFENAIRADTGSYSDTDHYMKRLYREVYPEIAYSIWKLTEKGMARKSDHEIINDCYKAIDRKEKILAHTGPGDDDDADFGLALVRR